MDLIQVKAKLTDQDKKRNRLLGQKEMAMKSLENHGFTVVSKAKKHSAKLSVEIDGMRKKYTDGCNKFKSKYEDLLI